MGSDDSDSDSSNRVETVSELLSPFAVADPQKGVVLFSVFDAVLIHLPGQPLVTVQTDLNHQREPRLNADVHQPEFTVDEVVIKTEALACGIDELRPTLTGNHLETLTWFEHPQDANQSLSNTVILGDLPREVFLAEPAVDVVKRPLMLCGDRFGMIPDTFRVLHDELFEFLDQQTLPHQQPFHCVAPTDGEITFEQNPVKTGDDTRDSIIILTDELFHGVLLALAV